MSAFTLSNTATARAVFVAKYVRDQRGYSRVAPARWVRSIERIIGSRSVDRRFGRGVDRRVISQEIEGKLNFPTSTDGWIRL
jgi:hypothetical protein